MKAWLSHAGAPGVYDIQYWDVTLNRKRERTSKGIASTRASTLSLSATVVVSPPAGGTAPAAEASAC